MRPVWLYCALLTGTGLAQLFWPEAGVWRRLLGLQLTMMGGYLAVLLHAGRADALRLLLRIRVGLGLLEVGWCAASPEPWLLLLGALDLAALVFVLGDMGQPAAPSPEMPSLPHNLLLGLIPWLEGSSCVAVAAAYGELAGVPAQKGELWVTLFGLHTLYLAVFWVVCVRWRCLEGIGATLWGRLLVALAFVGFTLLGVVTDQARLFWLVLPLAFSSAWTAWELARCRRS